ncbi:hypothetical protein PLESTF_001807500 [Pleodorina starrii]|nr:hypothetical protein PLESTF_001807500 [Pleodorina starrii]
MLAAHKGFEHMDASAFFWFHNPKVIAYIFNWAYYENSLSIAMLLFSLILGYQETWVFKGVPLWCVLLLLLADLLILVHSCYCVLPLYALIMPVGSHCPKEVLRRALKAGVFTRQTALIAKALHLQLKARETVAAAAAPPHVTLLGRITRHWKQRSSLPLGPQNHTHTHTAATAVSRAAQPSGGDTHPYNTAGAGGGGGSGLSPPAQATRWLSPRGGGGGGGGGGTPRSGLSGASTPRESNFNNSTSATAAPVAGVGFGPTLAPAGAGGGGGGGGGAPVLEATGRSDKGTLSASTLAAVPYGDVVGLAKPAVLAAGLATAPALSGCAPTRGSELMSEASDGVPTLELAPPSRTARTAAAAAAVPYPHPPVPVSLHPGATPHPLHPDGAAVGWPAPAAPLPIPVAPAPGRGPRARGAGAAHHHHTHEPSRFARLMQPFRGTAAEQPPAVRARGGGAQRDGSSHHSRLSTAEDDVMPFTGSGVIPSPSDSVLGAAAAAVAAAAPPRLSQPGGSPTGLMDLSLLRGGDLERQGSRDSLSSSLGRSGTIRTLMAGMYRGAVTQLTPEERRAAAASGLAVGRGGHGRALDMTLVPEG